MTPSSSSSVRLHRTAAAPCAVATHGSGYIGSPRLGGVAHPLDEQPVAARPDRIARTSREAHATRSCRPGCTGRIRISLTSTCGGWDTAYMTARAMSSGSSASDDAGCRRTACRPCPARSSVTRTPVSLSSWRGGLGHRRDRVLRARCRASRAARGGRRPSSSAAGGPRTPSAPGSSRGSCSAQPRTFVSTIVAPVLGRLLEKAARGAEAGVGEHDVDPPEGVERGLHHRLLLRPTR